jgi:hypothetical protein
MLNQSVLLVAVLSFCGLPALAAEYPPPYDAVYEQNTAGQKMTTKITSDGAGKVKTVSETPGGAVETLIDYPKKETTTVMLGQHMWMKQPLKEPYKDENALKKEAKSLGTKTFDGHPCHGYETKTANAVSQNWIGDDCHVLVHFETDTGVVKSVTDLKTFSGKAGDVSLSIPKDCKEFKAPVQK